MEPDIRRVVLFTDEEIEKKITKITDNRKVLMSMEDKDTYDPEGGTVTTITFKILKCEAKE